MKPAPYSVCCLNILFLSACLVTGFSSEGFAENLASALQPPQASAMNTKAAASNQKSAPQHPALIALANLAASLGPVSPLSAATPAAVVQPKFTPPPGVVVDATGSYALKMPNDFTTLNNQRPGTFEFVEAEIRRKYLAGFPASKIITYHVFNNKGVVKRIEEYAFADADKTILSKIITRFYDLDREVHVEEFDYTPPTYTFTIPTYTPAPPLPISKILFLSNTAQDYADGSRFTPAPQPQLQLATPARNFLRQWTIWNPRGEPQNYNISQIQSDRSFDPVTNINNRWISTEYNTAGIKTRVFEKNPDGSNRKIIHFNPNGSILRTEILNPVINPANILGPVTDLSRLRDPLPARTSNESYVRYLYEIVFGKVEPALAYYTHLINTGQKTRQQIYDLFTSTPVYRAKIVSTYYQTYLGRPADAGGLNHWVSTGYSLAKIAELIASSNEGYVVGLYRSLLGRYPDPGGKAHWVGLLNAGHSRATVQMAIYNSPEATHQNYIIGLYRSMLGRDPEPGAIPHWLNHLNSGRLDRYSLWLTIYRSAEAQQRRR